MFNPKFMFSTVVAIATQKQILTFRSLRIKIASISYLNNSLFKVTLNHKPKANSVRNVTPRNSRNTKYLRNKSIITY